MLLTHRLTGARQARQKGLTLLETLLAIAAGIGFVIGAVLLYTSATDRNQLQDGIQQVNNTISNVRLLFAGQNGFGTTDFTETAVNADIFEDRYLNSGSPVNPWDGAITLTGRGNFFDLSLEDVPQGSCIQLITATAGSLGGAVTQMIVNGANLAANPTPVEVNDACNAATNTIVFRVR